MLEPITPNRVTGFRHGAEALAGRLNDDPGTELDRRSPKRPSGSGPVHRHAAMN